MKEYKYMVRLYRDKRRRVCLFDSLEDVVIYLTAFNVEIDVESIEQNDVDDYQVLADICTSDVSALIDKVSYVPHVCFERLGV